MSYQVHCLCVYVTRVCQFHNRVTLLEIIRLNVMYNPPRIALVYLIQKEVVLLRRNLRWNQSKIFPVTRILVQKRQADADSQPNSN